MSEPQVPTEQVPTEQDQLRQRKCLQKAGRVVWVAFNPNPVLFMAYIVVSFNLSVDVPPQERNTKIFKNY